MSFLIGLDVERIQDYLFSVSRFKEIRGASHLLDRLISQIARGVIESNGGKPLLSAAGIVQAVVDDERQCAALIQSLKSAIRTELPEIDFVLEVVPISGGLGESIKSLQWALANKKTEKQPLVKFPHAGAMQYCDLCHREPAVKSRIAPGQAKGLEYLCRGCHRRATFNPNSAKAPIWHKEDRLLRVVSKAIESPLQWKVPDTIEELLVGWAGSSEADVEALQPANRYIGCIVADGNRMGEKLAGSKFSADLSASIAQLRDGSFAVEECLTQAIIDGLTETYLSRWTKRPKPPGLSQNTPCLPLFPLIAGGDDLLLLCKGTLAVPFAAAFCRRFGELSRADARIKGLFGSNALSISTGIAIAHAKFPLIRLQEIGHDLMREAKALSSELFLKTNAEFGALSFLRVSSGMFGSLEIVRSESQRGGSSSAIRKTSCPYVVTGHDQLQPMDVPDVESLLNAFQILRDRGFPSRRLYRIRDWLDLPIAQRDRTISEERDRMDPSHRKTLTDLCETLGCAQSVWRSVDGVADRCDRESPFPDLIDLEACHAE